MTKIKLKTFFLFQIILGISILVALISYAGAKSSIEILAKCRIFPTGFALLLIITSMLLGGIGVTVLGRVINKQMSWVEGTKGYLLTSILSLITPGKLADLTLPAFWRKHLAIHQTSSIVVLDKAITLLWVIVLSTLGIIMFFKWQLRFFLLVILLLLVSSSCLFIFHRNLDLFLIKCLPKKIYHFFSGTVNTFFFMFRNARFAIATNFLLTGLRMLFYGFVLVLLMESVRVEVELCPMIVLNAVSQFSTMIPITIYGIGIMESIWVAGFHRLNIAADSVIAAAIIGRTLVLISSILLWIIILLKKR